MAFLKLNQGGETCLVNVNYLMAVEPDEGGAMISLENGVTVSVDESTEEIWELLDQDDLDYFPFESPVDE